MGIADREYTRDPSAGTQAGRLEPMSVTTCLIVINVGIYLLNLMTVERRFPHPHPFGVLYEWGYFSATTALHFHQFWRFITFQFLHQNLEHLLFNMLALYVFGPLIEEYLGRRRYLAFYLLCGMAGAVLYLLLLLLHMLPDGSSTPLVGASAGIFGVLMAGAYVAPDASVMLLFPPIPLRLRWLAWILIAFAIYTILGRQHNAGGQAAHLGGAALGALLIRRPNWLNFVAAPRPKRN